MLTVVRAVKFLFAENAALKTVLLTRGIPLHVWEPDVARLVTDQELAQKIHAKFRHLYDEIEKAPDESKALQELLKALPKPKKDWN